MKNATEEIRIGELAIRFLLEGKDTAGAFAMFEFEVPSGGKVPAAHSHDAYEETAYGLQGVMTFTVNGERKEIRRVKYCRYRVEQYTASITSRGKRGNAWQF